MEFDPMLEWTGERFLPWIQESTIAYEHLHRYAYASTLVKDKRVLDLACGEGYGSKMLARSAASVVGVDIDENVIRHASTKYGATNLQFLSGPITAVAISADHSIDVIVCFEAIEHIEDQEGLLLEVKRLLKPDGVFIVSTPNKAIYHDESHDDNPFHVKELYFDEFQTLLARHFRHSQFLGQRIHPGSSIWPIGTVGAQGFHEFVMERGGSGFEFIDANKRVPMYFIAIASDAHSALPPLPSALVDESDGLLMEKDQERDRLVRQIKDRDETIDSLQEAVKWREGQIEELGKSLEELHKGLEWMQVRSNDQEQTIASRDQTIASHEQALAWRAGQVSELETAKEYWMRESESLTVQLQNTQRQLAKATDTLTGIYASRGWKLILKLRSIRDTLMGLVRSRG
jgi:SAM-dependent methyltransferase